jgi:protein O-GlcNAc transferase
MDSPQAEFRDALALHQRGDLDAAERVYKSILRSQPKYFDAIFALGIVYLQREEFRAAEKQFLLAIKIDPNNSPLQNNFGSALLGLGRPQDALAAYDLALSINPQNIEAHYNRGNALAAMKRFEEAVASYDRSIALSPNNAQVHDNRGSALANLSRIEAALASFSRAIQLNPRNAKAYANRAGAYAQLKQYDKALEDYERAFACDPTLDFVASNKFAMQMHICQWDGYETEFPNILEGIRNGTLKAEPFTLLVFPSTLEDQLKCAEQYTRDKAPAAPRAHGQGRRYAHDRIRIGYVSSDFHDHPVTHLIAGMLEAHDRSRFEIHGFSTAPVKDDKYRSRVVKACDAFVNAQAMGTEEFSRRIREAEIDILVDLNGHTTGARTDIFAARSAPVQVAHLGFPGTMGAEYIDYLIADRHLVPEAAERAYTEKIVCLPNSYQPNDSKRVISEKPVRREDFGLPPAGFVFCCFNNNFKVTPDIFTVWMRLLKAVDGSALWLYCDNRPAEENLKREAERHGVAAARLVFAKKLPLEEYRAQYRLADLFVDTLYYNAHTIGSDALWAGLPLITCTEKTFAGRVATSLLHAASLPELAVDSIGAYEKLAFRLATNPEMLGAIKSRLEKNRDKLPLFDTERYTRDLEAAYTQMRERSQKGKPPQSFEVVPHN